MNFTEYLSDIEDILIDNGFYMDTLEEDECKDLVAKFKKCFKLGLEVDAAVDKVMNW